jgi:hypothetical protein
MKFLNKKEQVIDLEVTPYGKSLLARGKFKPHFYAFFDDDILYDSQYGGVTETQNSASVRINDVPQLETQAHFYSIEKQVKEATIYQRLNQSEQDRLIDNNQRPSDPATGKPYVLDDDLSIGTIPDRNFSTNPLGRSSIDSSNLPAWDVGVLKGKISGSNNFLTGTRKDQKIPQLDMDAVVCTLKLSNEIESENNFTFVSENNLNGKVLNLISDSIVLEVNEDNVDFERENFDIEVYEVQTHTFSNTDGSTRNVEHMIPLFFKQQASLIQNGILLDPEEIKEIDIEINSNYSEYYMNIGVDMEIDQKELCEYKPQDKARGIFSKRQLECSELEEQDAVNIDSLYDTEEFDGECE